MNSIAKLLDIQYPIFQGAMAHIARYPLASAVSEAGGLGIYRCWRVKQRRIANKFVGPKNEQKNRSP